MNLSSQVTSATTGPNPALDMTSSTPTSTANSSRQVISLSRPRNTNSQRTSTGISPAQDISLSTSDVVPSALPSWTGRVTQPQNRQPGNSTSHITPRVGPDGHQRFQSSGHCRKSCVGCQKINQSQSQVSPSRASRQSRSSQNQPQPPPPSLPPPQPPTPTATKITTPTPTASCATV